MTVLPFLLAAALAPAPDTVRYLVLNHGRPAGDMVVVRAGDSVVVRYVHVDRNRGTRSETRYHLDRSGAVVVGVSQPLVLGTGQPAGFPERMEVVGDSVRWSGRVPTGSAPRSKGYYRLRTGTSYDAALLAAHLLARPGRSVDLLPSGTARLEIVGDTVLRTTGPGGGRHRLRLAAIHGRGPTPEAVWIDDRGALVASSVGWFITVRPDVAPQLPALRAIEVRWRARQDAAVSRAIAARGTTGPLVIRGGDVFDADRGVVRPRTTVVVQGDRITAVGPDDSVAAPPGATVIDATGKTVVPGLWEMHGHAQLTAATMSAPMQLAIGVTTVRDLAADTDVAVSHRDRTAKGELVSPRYVLGGFLEGPGAWAGPSDVIVRTEDEARAWVARYDSLGYAQVKLYNLVHPDLVPTIAEEAHKRGLRVSGHVPRGLTVPAAVKLGFDEINHAAFLFSTFYQDSLYVPTMRPYSAVAQIVAPRVNVDGPEMTALIATLKQHGTVVDGTFNLWMRVQPGVPASEELQASDASYLKLVKRLFDAGVTLVPGTDAPGSTTYNTELELYERAGVPAREVLRMATIVSARVMKQDRDHGSIAPGKAADLVIVDGRPHERIADLRRVVRVVRAGRAYEPQALYDAIGFQRAQQR